MDNSRIITIFGSSQITERDATYQEAMQLGRKLAEAGYTICNGGYGGIMEATARGAKEGKGKTIGVTAEDFKSSVNRWIDEEIRMKRWSERLFKLIELGDAYLVFDGSTGTLVELFVVWEMLNKKFISKPMIILGNQLQNLITQARKLPRIVNSSFLFFAGTADEAIKLLGEKVGKHA